MAAILFAPPQWHGSQGGASRAAGSAVEKAFDRST
jgi:hypothetical protein